MSERSTIVRPYARAVFDLALDEGEGGGEGEIARWSSVLALMAALVAVPEMEAAIDDPAVSRDEVLGILFDIGCVRFDERARNLLRVLSDNRRLKLLPLLAEQYEALRAEEERRSAACVVTAHPFSPDQEEKLRRALETSLGRRVHMDCVVDEGLIGGAVIRVGDRVIDGSALGRLGALARELV